ncbi:acyl-CoA thioesterase [Lichenifustis flavocetrariae]|uniref:Acyl-CoA thioesterase n=1 Tax=Lichenifustis flavocetrariae TaxID=2949735 RepID=A0AA41Z455_9HYPH|nr:thioesterase family protein [Lichenifustis flavocetrariae]MCW6510000.1 acyl-CoA thioesterase [Lichenifustis flavocetrariae]
MTTAERKRIEPLTRTKLPTAVWSTAVPIRFRHCDPAGIVFTPRYFDILNEAVEQFFGAALGLDYYLLISERKIGLGYAQASCEFLKPSRMGEVLDVAVLVERIGGSSYTLVLPVFKDGVEVVRGRLVTVTTMLEAFTSRPIPDDIRAGLEGYRDRCGEAIA